MDSDNKLKFEIFIEVAKALNKSFDLIPVLYGSLGLYRMIQASGKVNDVDILIPDEVIKEKWEELKKLMSDLGFTLKDEGEHEFARGEKFVAFATDLDLVEMIGIKPANLNISEVNGAKFKELSPEQYLELYQFMLRDNYRQEKRGTADQDKIHMIKTYLADKN